MVLLLVAAVHVGQGSASVGLGDVLDTLLGKAPGDVSDVVAGSRGPRLLAGLVAGAALAVAGVLLQTVTRNPLAAPDTLAVNAGAYLAVVIVVVSGVRLGMLPAGGVAFAGGLAAALIVYLIAAGVGVTPTRLLLAGVAVTLALTSATAVLLLLFEQQTTGMFLWGQGSLVQSGVDRALGMLPLVLVIVLAGILLARTFDVIGTGDDTARSVGASVGKVRLGGILVAVLGSSAAVTICGPVGFVGLVAPHLVRLCGVHRHRFLVPVAAVWGAALLLLADVLARLLSGPDGSELPAGIVTAVAGAPFFLWLARREKAGAGTASAHATGIEHSRIPYPAVVSAAVIVLLVAALLALRFGEETVPWGEVFATLFSGEGLVPELRAPRVVIAIVAGAALAASGLVLQGVVRNPLAEPALLGVTGGAGVGALLVLFVFPAAVALLPLGALLGATVAFGLTYAVSWSGGGGSKWSGRRREGRAGRAAERAMTPTGPRILHRGVVPERLILVGIGVSALTAALVGYLVAVRQLQVSQALTWLTGSIYGRGWGDALLLAWIPVALIVAWVGGRQLDVLALGDDPSRSMGIRLEPVRLALLGLAVALAAGAVAVVGTIGFVGLVAPHAARSLVAGRHRRLLVVAMLFGALLVLVADTIGRTILAPKQIPAGIITALIGTPYFAYRLWRTKDRRL